MLPTGVHAIVIPMDNHESLLDTLLSNKDEVTSIVRSCGGTEVRVFGSVARREDTPNSDIDLVVTLDDDAGLSDLMTMQEALRCYLRRRVDVITMASIVDPANHFPSHRRDQILGEAVRL